MATWAGLKWGSWDMVRGGERPQVRPVGCTKGLRGWCGPGGRHCLHTWCFLFAAHPFQSEGSQTKWTSLLYRTGHQEKGHLPDLSASSTGHGSALAAVAAEGGPVHAVSTDWEPSHSASCSCILPTCFLQGLKFKCPKLAWYFYLFWCLEAPNSVCQAFSTSFLSNVS